MRLYKLILEIIRILPKQSILRQKQRYKIDFNYPNWKVSLHNYNLE